MSASTMHPLLLANITFSLPPLFIQFTYTVSYMDPSPVHSHFLAFQKNYTNKQTPKTFYWTLVHWILTELIVLHLWHLESLPKCYSYLCSWLNLLFTTFLRAETVAHSFYTLSMPSTEAGAQKALNKSVVLDPDCTLESPKSVLKIVRLYPRLTKNKIKQIICPFCFHFYDSQQTSSCQNEPYHTLRTQGQNYVFLLIESSFLHCKPNIFGDQTDKRAGT